MSSLKIKNKIKDKIGSWKCLTHYGYGHGRALSEFGQRPIRSFSVCRDLCPRREECRKVHHAKMDKQYPEISGLVAAVVTKALEKGEDVVRSIVRAMQSARDKNFPGTDKISRKLEKYGIEDMTDHYVCGEFDNIQNGIDGADPTREIKE